MKYKIGDEIKIKYYFHFIEGIIKDYKNGFYGVEADGKYFPTMSEDNIYEI